MFRLSCSSRLRYSDAFQLGIILLAQRLIHPCIHFLPIAAFESDCIAGLPKRLDLLQAE